MGILIALFMFLIYLAAPSFMPVTKGAVRRTFESNHRLMISVVEMYKTETNGKYPMRFDEISKFLDDGSLDGNPKGATYNLINGILISELDNGNYDITIMRDVISGKELRVDIEKCKTK